MKNQSTHPSESVLQAQKKGFTLMETVIAIGVLAVLLTGFIAVFTPAAQGIRRSISAQQADRLATTLEQELVTLRPNQEASTITTGFEKAFDWILKGSNSQEAIFVYQYRGDSKSAPRSDGSLEPMAKVSGQPGVDYTIQPMARRASDPEFAEDLKAIDGAIFFVVPTQLIYNADKMELGKIGEIRNPDGATAGTAEQYQDAVIAFSAEFYSIPSKSISYIEGTGFQKRFNEVTSAQNAKRPVFTRNLAVRR